MTRSVYVVGGAGTGKSTFMQKLLDATDRTLGPLVDLHAKPNKKAVVTLRGHSVGTDGMYLGCMRESFPGTDGLDRASSPTGKQWLELGMHSGLKFIVGEGATLATRPFLTALHAHTELLLVHLTCDPWLKELRLAGRGSNQADTFILGTATRSANLAGELHKLLGVPVVDVDTEYPDRWDRGLEMALAHILPDEV